MITKEDIIKDLKKIRKEIKKLPSLNDYQKFGSFDKQTVRKKFGSWNNALMECFGEINNEKPKERPIIKCYFCGKETKNPKYCSQSCSAKMNNSLFPKNPKKEPKKCLKCKTLITKRAKFCKTCHTLTKIEKFSEKTINDFSSTYARHRYQAIRHHAHRIAKYNNFEKKCPLCNYKNHVELSHIKDISKFDKNTKLKIVNHPDNLIFLCPNHHWDLDHGFLDPEILIKLKKNNK